MRQTWALGVLIVVAAGGWADAPPAKKADKAAAAKAVTVPFDLLKSGHMTVKVKVNGKGPYTLIFDTGAPITLLNNKIAREAELLKDADRPLFALFGAGGEVKVKDLQVGDQKAENVAAVVMDHPTVEAISRVFGPIDGIVGFPFFARYKMTLDYQAKTITLTPNGYKPPDVVQSMIRELSALGTKTAPKVLSPAAQWGMLVQKAADDEADGVVVKEVLPGGAAAAAGMKSGDRLLTLGGRWTDSLTDLFAAAGYVKPDETAVVVVKRGDKEVTIRVKPVSGL